MSICVPLCVCVCLYACECGGVYMGVWGVRVYVCVFLSRNKQFCCCAGELNGIQRPFSFLNYIQMIALGEEKKVSGRSQINPRRKPPLF